MFNKKKTSKKKQIKKEKEQSDIVMFEDFDSNKNCEGDQKNIEIQETVELNYWEDSSIEDFCDINLDELKKK
ncbi:hypothetical protein HDJGFE_00720 [Metamycoplasma hominis]|uniref:Uncharacterized protein n=1 Tax=Metamycoplasma hominis TaxID=2098 RepID=A0A454CA58_METHO|nr:hypothetical protein [Metamycoplasma hominis]AIU34244.1 hypothetical protein MLBD4_02715 [Metamycoplasma hominis ATCC 27545]AYK04836.1 hypothetical protein D9D13_02640 [Metamycoplasma hominis]AYN65602.1 hypothetical protein KN71_002820 [Metamycoplasma hominis]KGF61277.1 hypothetical protein JX73_01875 [Metamycoplasma hominis]MDU7418742.1 hypothetical protein [Metamycoplasma hominis]